MAILGAMSSMTVNGLFKRKLKLQSHGIFFTLCTMAGPGALTAVSHEFVCQIHNQVKFSENVFILYVQKAENVASNNKLTVAFR